MPPFLLAYIVWMSESFIYQSYISDLSLCDRIIQAYWDTPDKPQGEVGAVSESGIVDKTIKDSVDILLEGALKDDYFSQLRPVVDAYKQKYPQCDMYSPWGVVQNTNIQYYKPGGGFFAWHTERTIGADRLIASRHLVFMTYLNDVTDGGETEFQLQGVKVQPRKGLSLIWPADWTHTHRGITSPTQEKFIVTGWFNFLR